MGFWKKIFRRRGKKQAALEEQEIDCENWEKLDIRKENFDMEDVEQREKYVRCLLEQIGDAKLTLQSLSGEYASVTSYLKDIEEIEALPAEEKEELLSCAATLRTLKESRDQNPVRKNLMSDELYHRMERVEPEIEEGIQKLTEQEEYQELIKRDLRRLDSERQAYEIRQTELMESMSNSKAVSVICISAMVICIAGLLVFQLGLHMDTRIGYILTGLLAGGVLTFVFVKFREADTELAKVQSCIHKLVLLQNRVKIRYVNNTNLLDYLYMKYKTESAAELEKQLQLFRKEREERERYAKVIEDMGFYQKELMRILRRYQLYDPTIWIHQTDALLDPKEMVEIRHQYVGQRQKLRKQMERNQELSDQGSMEIHRLVKAYPAYAKRILQIVDEYDQKIS